MERDAQSAGRPFADLPDCDEISAYHLYDEEKLVGSLVERAIVTGDERRRTEELARRLVRAVRAGRSKQSGIDAFMDEYGLSSEEGVILLCLAESLLRIPDAETADKLIAEKVGGGEWDAHVGHSQSLFVNASTFGLMLTGRIVRLGGSDDSSIGTMLRRMVAKSGEPVIRQALRQAMRLLGKEFVMGRTIQEALGESQALEDAGYRISYDMLGEAAWTDADADRYLERYQEAIEAVGRAAGTLFATHGDALMARPGISVKLSAIHSRFEAGKEERLQDELIPRVLELARRAKDHNLVLTIDAEEQDLLEMTLKVFGAVALHRDIAGWPGLGIAIQAYGKRAIPALRWLRRISVITGTRLPVRLVKGAYWDSEIKWAQERGLDGYPVFTRKLNTDVSYLACLRHMLSDTSAFFTQVATHNAQTLAAAHVLAGSAAFEFQKLFGMGDTLYQTVGADATIDRPCRIYAPVGGHEDLLAYLVRRLLENGANTSFVNRIGDEKIPVEEIVQDPIAQADAELSLGQRPKLIAGARDLFQPERINSQGLALTDSLVRGKLLSEIEAELAEPIEAGPIINATPSVGGPNAQVVRCPHNLDQRVGRIVYADDAAIAGAIQSAARGVHAWDQAGGEQRARILEQAAINLEQNRARLMALMVREAGKTLENAQADLREAVDFLRYYACEARRLFAGPTELAGPTGERNELTLRARGPVACISPWNFPVAIFTGQVAAALAAGNTVLAKPAEQTSVVAFLVTQLLLDAGVPPNALHLLPGAGDVGARLVADPMVKAVVFTGSNETAWAIQKTLCDRRAAIVPFIAETGGINAMIADSSALPEQVVRDCVRSAFDSAGQRCSAARVLFVQEDVAERMIDMLVGAVDALDIGDPLDYATDIGPVIDQESVDRLEAYKANMYKSARVLVDKKVPLACRVGTYVSPAVFEIDGADQLHGEVFGPILHVVRYQQGALDKVIQAINGLGYGLTLGVHSRIEAVADYVNEHACVGNIYVNRNQIGAVVGVQPFGGEGLSGTGPKAGGRHYVARLATERVRTTDITATGGNVALLSMVDERTK